MAQITWYDKDALTDAAKALLKPAPVVLDVGCGIRPQVLIPSMIHIGIEPFLPYIEAWHEQYGHHTQYVPLHGTWDEIMPHFPDKSVDTVIAGDVIEHLEKSDGWKFLAEAERVARGQIVVFTPIGFQAQGTGAHGSIDRWGMAGGHWQTHRSGWLPTEFDDRWECLCCEAFHFEDEFDQPLDHGFGAFYGIRSF